MSTHKKSSTAVRAAAPARVVVIASRGTRHTIRVIEGELPAWLLDPRRTLVSTYRLAPDLYIVDCDEIGEAEARNEIEIVEVDDRPRARARRAA